MSYVIPSEFAEKMIDAGEAKVLMSTKDTLIRSFMAVPFWRLLPPLR